LKERKKKKMKFQTIISLISITLLTFAVLMADAQESSKDPAFCSIDSHTGKFKTESEKSTQSGKVTDKLNYKTRFSNDCSGNFYEDGSFICLLYSCYNCLCRYGFTYDGTKTHQEIGQLYGDFKVDKKLDKPFIKSYIGIYGLTKDPQVEYYIVDD